MSVTTPVTFVDGADLYAQQLNSNFSAHATEINTNGADIATNTSNISTNTTNIAKYGKNAFFAQSAGTTTLSSTAVTTVEVGTEVHDADGVYAAGTYIFTPNQAGSYFLTASAQVTSLGSGRLNLYITKNTTNYKVGVAENEVVGSTLGGSVLLTANGTSDYFLVRAESTVDTNVNVLNVSFSGFCVKPS